MASLAGTTLGDLFVFGDIRDAVRQGTRYVRGEQVDQLVLGLAATGIAITAGTYVTFGAATPARAGLTLVKAARKTGRLGVEFTESLGRMVRQTSFPAATRAARDTAKVERAGGLLHLVRDVGRIEKAAGGRAALDALKIAKGPRDITRVAKLAEKEGSHTRAILKVAGRSAIMCSSGYRLVTDRLPSFTQLSNGPAAATFAVIPLLVVAAPFLILRNTVLGQRQEGRRFEFVFLATLIAGFWSLMSGLVLVTTLQALLLV